VKWNDRDLEKHPCRHQDYRHQQEVSLIDEYRSVVWFNCLKRDYLRKRRCDVRQVCRAGQPIDHRDAIEQHSGWERSQQEVLHRRFGGGQPAKGKPRQQVERQRQDFQGQENEDEVGSGDDQGHPCRAKEQQWVVLASRFTGPIQVVIGEKDTEGRDRQQDEPEKDGELVGGHHVPQDRGRTTPRPQQDGRNGGAGDAGQRQDHQYSLVANGPQGIQQKERDPRPD
jgi:hypothetical protein